MKVAPVVCAKGNDVPARKRERVVDVRAGVVGRLLLFLKKKADRKGEREQNDLVRFSPLISCGARAHHRQILCNPFHKIIGVWGRVAPAGSGGGAPGPLRVCHVHRDLSLRMNIILAPSFEKEQTPLCVSTP